MCFGALPSCLLSWGKVKGYDEYFSFIADVQQAMVSDAQDAKALVCSPHEAGEAVF